MKDNHRIPIKNIYYMLCYAWNLLEQLDNIQVGSEKFDNIYNLFARIYIKDVSKLIKRGLNRYYIQENEEISTIKGKINISDSIKKQTFNKGKMICCYDNFSEDIKLNQIVKTTIEMLIKVPNLDRNLKDKLLKLRIHFLNIQEVRFSNKLFSNLRYNGNNKHYRMLIHISKLLYEGLIINEEGNETIFSEFLKEDQMAKLYEKFVLNFYRIHLDEKRYFVHSPKIRWNLDYAISEVNMYLLPEMRTDIVIEDKVKKTQLIIDTKYYLKALVSSNWSDVEKVRTGHLYQILAYINNSKFDGEITGMLLYPTIDKELNACFPICNNKIYIKTVNLNVEWNDIETRLLSFIE